eukprot:scaffold77256_cov51-Phaeocystis_antarctica.AAC.2
MHAQRLEHVGVGAREDAALDQVDALVGGDHDHGDGVADLADLAQQLVARDARHHDVREHQVDRRVGAHHLERLGTVRAHLRRVAALLAQQHDRVRLERVVLHDEHLDHTRPRGKWWQLPR